MIDHGLLLRKLENYGIQDGELTWFQNYLNDRRQRIIVGGARSSWHAVGSATRFSPRATAVQYLRQ